MNQPKVQTNKMGAAITVRLLHGDSNKILDVLEDGTLSILLVDEPESSKANRELTSFLSKLLKIPLASIEIIAGLSGQNKLVAISGLNPAAVQAIVLESLGLTQAELNRRRQ
jgi:uncharacterized protein YggU (UPF0235/DUF167 family)